MKNKRLLSDHIAFIAILVSLIMSICAIYVVYNHAVKEPPQDTLQTQETSQPSSPSVTEQGQVAAASSLSSNTLSFLSQTLETKSGLLRVYYFDVGQGDCALVILPNGETILVDGGDNQYGQTVVDLLRALSANKINYLVASHPHADHIGGLDTVIENLDIDKTYMPEIMHTTQTFEDLLAAIESKGLSITTITPGLKIIENEELKVQFLGPVTKTNIINNMSAILKITYKDTSFLFMGDAEEESENEILNAGYDLSAQIIKIGHHGSRSSTSLQLLTAVNPKVAVISCGKDNKYGHPNQETLYKLNDQNISYYRTDQNGTVVITSNGTDFEYQIEKQGQKNNPTNAPPQITSTPNSTTSKADIAKEKSNDNVIVYTTKTGECYHKGTCSSLRKSKFETTVREAKADGYRACQNCNPPQ